MRQKVLLLSLCLAFMANWAIGQTTYYSKSTATDFNDVNSWGTATNGTGTSPSSVSNADIFVVGNGANMTLSAAASVQALYIGSVTSFVPATATGTLTVSGSNSLTVAKASGYNTTLGIGTSGTLNVSGGTITLNGNFAMSGGNFNQTGGAITIDGNDNNTAATSVPSGTPIFGISAGTPNCSAGTITIVDPCVSSYVTGGGTNRTILIGLSASTTYFTGTHTFITGDGVSTTAGNSDGFVIETYSNSYSPIQNLTVNGNGTNRWTTASNNASTFYGCHIKGNLTINSGSEMRQSYTSGLFAVGGNIINNGTLTVIGSSTTSALVIGTNSAFTVTGAQTISGTGVFRNATSSPTANFSYLTINNPNGVTFSTATALTGTGTGTVSSTLTLTAGAVNASGNTFTLGTGTGATGTLAGSAGGFSSGSTFARWFAAATAGTTITASAVPSFTGTGTYPFVNGGSSRNFYLQRPSTSGATGGVIAVAFNEGAGGLTTLGSSVTDGSYTIDRQSTANWTVSTSNSFAAGTGTFTYALSNASTFTTVTTNSRIMKAATVVGTHQAGTTLPHAQRTAIAAADYTGAFYMGINATDVASPCATPANQPTSQVASSVSSSAISGTFTAAASAPTNYLIVAATNGAIPSAPVNGTNYTVGTATLGTNTTIISNGTAATFSASSLASNTAYTFYIYSFNTGTCSGGPKYNTTSPLSFSVTTCPAAPTGVGTASITTTGFILNWTAAAAGGSAIALGYTVDVSTNSTFTAPVSGSPFTASGTSLTLTGLNPATVYYYRVGAVGACTTYATSGSVSTLCSTFSLPLAQGFNTSGTTVNPACWTQQNVSGSLGIQYVTTTAGSSPAVSTPYEGTRMVFYNSYSNSTSTRLVSPPMTTVGAPSVDVSFQWYYSVSGGTGSYPTEGVTVQWSTDGTTWNNFSNNFIRRYGPVQGWAPVNMTLPAGTGNQSTLYVGFLLTGNAGYDIYMDTARVDATPACVTPAPGNTLATNQTTCLGTTTTLSVQNVTPGAGVTYQWDSSLNGTTYSPITGATGTTYTALPSAATYYRLNVTCSYASATTTSTPIQINVTNCNFNVARTTGNSYTSIASTGSSFAGWNSATNTDDNTSGTTPIGFSFLYKGNTYTKFKVCTNGWLTLDTTTTQTTLSNAFTSSTKLFLAPLWEDLVCPGNPATAAGLASSIKYQTTGTAPNRICTVEWIGMEKYSYAGPNLNFQVKLYENGNIDYAYGTMEGFNGTSTNLYSITVGLSSANGTGTTMADVMSQQVENTNFFAAISQNNLTTVQDCNSTLSFTPGNYTGPTTYTVPPPANDDIPGAISLTVNPVPCTSYCGTYFSSKSATASPQSSSCTTAPDDDVWFTFSAPTSGQVKVTVLGSEGYDPVVSLYDNFLNAVGTFGCVNANGTGAGEVITATSILPSANYYVRVSHNGTGYGTSSGMFSICVSDNVPPPVNDNICGAVSLLVDTACVTTSGSTVSATASTGAPTGCNTPDDDIWYVFMPNSNDNLLTVQSGSGFNASVQIDTAASNVCSNTLYQVTCINSTSTGGVETFSGPWIIGKPYYIRVYHAGVGAGTGNFTICVRSVPPSCVTVTAPAASASVPSGSGGTTITWTASLNASGYDVYLSTTQGNVTSQNPIALVSPNQPGLSYATGALTPSTIYYYKIVPRNAFGQPNNGCTTYDFNTNPPACLSAPTSPVNSGTPCSVSTATTLSWPASAGATGYDVYFDAGSGPATTLVSSNQIGTTYVTSGPLAAGSYSWRVVPKNSNGSPTGCPDWSFTVLQSPSVSVTPTTTSFCGTNNTPAALTASGTATSYVWSPTTGLYTNAAGTTAYTGGSATTVYANPTQTAIYTVTGSSSVGCTATATATITINPAVTVSPTAKQLTLCPGGGTDTLYANAGVATSAYCAAVNQGSALITNVTLNTLSNNTSSNQPSALPYYTQFPATGTQTTTLTAGSTYTVGVDLNGTGIVSVWIDYDHDGILSATEWVQPYTAAATGTATISVPATALNGLTRMRVRSRLNGNPNGSGDACLSMGSGETEDYDITITGGVAAGGLTYVWTPSTNLNSGTVANPEATITTTTKFYVTATSAGGCSATDSVTVTVGSTLTANTTVSAPVICAGATIDTLKSTVTGGGTPYAYSWSDGSSVIGTTSKLTVSPTTTTTYTLTVTDACSSTTTSSVTITVNPNPTAVLSPSATTTNICAGGTQAFTASSNTGTVNYQYQLNGTDISGATASNYTTPTAGRYTVKVTNTGTGCFSLSATDTLIVNQLPRVFISPTSASTTCGGTPVQITAQTISPTIGLLFSEEFNAGLGGFTQSTGATHAQGNFLSYPSGYVYSSNTFTTSDASNFVMINSDSNGSGILQRLYLTSSSFATTGYDSVKLTMEDFYQLWTSGDSAIAVQASTDATNWTTFFDIKALGTHGSAGSFAKDTVSLPIAFSNQPNVYLRIQYASTYGYWLAINRINVIGQSLIPAVATWSEATDLYTNSSATTPYVMNTTASSVYANPSTDMKYVATYSNGTCSNTATVSITVTGSPSLLASGSSKADTGNVFNTTVAVRDQNCNLIATIAPSGGQPIAGNFEARVTNDNSVQSYLSLPYATRHYDINPENNAANATATLKLYFTQAEMNAYNSYLSANNLASIVTPMPTSATDLQGMADLRIKQYHGTGTAPGSYTGTTQTIKPSSVTWNSTNSWWEVTLPVNGFSGFYLTTGRFPTIAVKAYLQGALNSGTTMDNYYQDYFGTGSGLLPTTNPYGVPGGTYNQINASAGPVGAIVDWVKVEVRDSANPSNILETRALLMKTNGSIVDSLGNAPYFGTQASKVMLAVWHRNHLAILSNPISAPSQDEVKTYDFSASLSQASNPYGDPQQMVQKNGKWCMWAGDVNIPQDLFIDNVDILISRNVYQAAPFDVYNITDLNLDGSVDNTDFLIERLNYQQGVYSTLSNY